MHSTTVAGESANPTRKHLMELASEFRMKNGTAILEQVANAVSQWKALAKDAGVTKESMELIDKRIQTTLKK